MPSRLVLFVGDDASAAERCERAVAPFPLVHTKFLGTAVDFAQTMRPLIVLAAPDVASQQLAELRRACGAEGLEVLSLAEAEDADLSVLVHEAVEERLP